MLNLAKYAAVVAAFVVGLGVATTKPASAWAYLWGYSCADGCGYGYGAFGPWPYGFYPYGYDDNRPYYGPHFDGYYRPRPFYRHRL
jgi:hypothetical protein